MYACTVPSLSRKALSSDDRRMFIFGLNDEGESGEIGSSERSSDDIEATSPEPLTISQSCLFLSGPSENQTTTK
jgi:hypothetical protein